MSEVRTPKFLAIRSFGKEDTKALFDAMCKEILNESPAKVKQSTLKLNGTKKELDEFNPTFQSILTLIATHDIKFRFEVQYVGSEKVEVEEPEHIDPIKKEMADQAKVIAPEKESVPAIKKEIKPVAAVIENKSSAPVKDDDIPDFE